MIRDPETLNALLDTINRFVRERLVPAESIVDETDQIPADIIDHERQTLETISRNAIAQGQIIADILGADLLAVSEPQDAGARGVGALGLVATGAERDVGFLRDEVGIERTFRPAPDRRAAADETYERYRALYEALRPLFHRDAITDRAAAAII